MLTVLLSSFLSHTSGDLYRHIALTSGTVNTCLLPRTLSLTTGPIASSLQQSAIHTMQSLAMQAV